MKNKVFQLDACKFPGERQSHAEVQLSQSAAQRDLTLRWQVILQQLGIPLSMQAMCYCCLFWILMVVRVREKKYI